MSDFQLINNNFPNIKSEKPGTETVFEVASKGNGLTSGSNFQTMLEEQLRRNQLNGTGRDTELHFSKHALERVTQRGIDITGPLMDDLKGAVEKARAKGSRDCVVIDSSGAFIVNIPNNVIITAVSGDEMKENIFTNIDSAVIV